MLFPLILHFFLFIFIVDIATVIFHHKMVVVVVYLEAASRQHVLVAVRFDDSLLIHEILKEAIINQIRFVFLAKVY